MRNKGLPNWPWVRLCFNAFEAIAGIALALISIYVSVNPPSPERKAMWIVISICLASLFVIAVTWRGVHEAKREAQRDARDGKRNELLVAKIKEEIIQVAAPSPPPSPVPAPITESIPTASAATSEPDVALEFSSPGPFVLHNFGTTACEVTVSNLAIPEFYEVQFQSVPDFHSDRREIASEVAPTGLWEMLDRKEAKGRSIMDFLSTLARGRAMDIQIERTGTHVSSAITDELVAAMEPISLPITVTYKDRHGKRQWVKNETLIYDPPKRYAYIKHGERKEVELSH